MNKTEYPLLGEAVYAHTLPCGLEIRVIPKQGFAKTYAFLAANYGSVDMTFRDGDELVQAPLAWLIIWNTKCSTCPRATPCSNLLPPAPVPTPSPATP
mgnify:CR=1 FL=1